MGERIFITRLLWRVIHCRPANNEDVVAVCYHKTPRWVAYAPSGCEKQLRWLKEGADNQFIRKKYYCGAGAAYRVSDLHVLNVNRKQWVEV